MEVLGLLKMLIQINTYIVVMVLNSICAWSFHYLAVAWVKNIIISGVNMSSSVHIACKEKDILIFDKGPIQGLDDTTLTTEAQYSINLSRSKRKFCFSLQYNESNRFFICYCYKNISIQSKRFWYQKISLVFSKYFRKIFS